jgi:hypothetical protein
MTRFGRVVIPAVLVLTAIAAIVLFRRPLQMTFASPKQAVEELVIALRHDNLHAAKLILGPGSAIIVRSGDNVADKRISRRFIAAYETHEAFAEQTPSRVMVLVGPDDWPFPIPLVKESDGWRFDSGAGKRELLARRIGRNEIDAINECKAFVDAEREYAAADHGDGVLKYAQHLNSSRAKEDGLYWISGKHAARSPLGPAFAKAEAGPERGNAQPYNGYYFRILTAQGPAARGGAFSYLAHGKMIGGFALIAYPAKCGSTGIMSFIINDDAVAFEKNLGTGTSAIAGKMKSFDPDAGWTRTEGSTRTKV